MIELWKHKAVKEESVIYYAKRVAFQNYFPCRGSEIPASVTCAKESRFQRAQQIQRIRSLESRTCRSLFKLQVLGSPTFPSV